MYQILDHVNILENKDRVDLDNIINKKYLTAFDVAPIDHMRELVKTNKKVRNAVAQIHSGQADKLSDEVKKELYLYGIINSAFDKMTFIKNPIISHSLSQEWISGIDKQNLDDYYYAIRCFELKDYDNTIISLLEFLQNSSPTENQIEVSKYCLGSSYFNTNDFEKAAEYFTADFSNQKYKYESKALLGLCNISLKNTKEALEILEEVAQDKRDSSLYFNVLLTLATNIKQDDRALSLYKELFQYASESKEIDEDILSQFKTVSLYHQSTFHSNNGNIDTALENINSALLYSSLSDSIHLKYVKHYLEGEINENIGTEIVKTIIDNDLKFDRKNSNQISFDESSFIVLLDFLFDYSDIDIFKEFIEYAENDLFEDKSIIFSHIYLVSQQSVKKEEFLKYLLTVEEKISEEIHFSVLQDLAFLSKDDKETFFSYFKMYRRLFSQLELLTVDDLNLFLIGIKLRYNSKELEKSIELCASINKKINETDDESLKVYSISISYWYAFINLEQNKINDSIEYAKKTLIQLEGSEDKFSAIVSEEGFKTIKQQMEEISSFSNDSPKINKPITRGRKYGANEKIKVQYSNGKIVEKNIKN